uniref:Uncharacterized protein n=1 Tax=Anopheles arabiensis TaxID=7173 RepID=A0A182IFI4_ANOAR
MLLLFRTQRVLSYCAPNRNVRHNGAPCHPKR